MDARRHPPADHGGDWSAEFLRKRRRAWRKARWAVLILAVAFAAAWWDVRWFIAGFVGCFGALLWIIWVWRRHYLGPACGETPMTNGPAFGTEGILYDKSVDLDPEFCSNCGVRLKPEPEVKRLFF
jgi:hypothetical protein